MKFLILIVATFAAVVTCSTQSNTKTARTHSKAKRTKSTGVLKDSAWVTRYKAEEEKYHYSIPQDTEIKAEGNKFRVPQSVVDHYADMEKTTNSQ